jgi:hypothetical protein
MTKAWRSFLFVRFPLALLALGVICQLASIGLAHLPMRRNRLDELALAVMTDPQPHRIVLLGDSIIRNATLQYGVGSATEVLNLATQRIVGLPGGLLLLQRYLQTHRPPQYVVVAAAPDDYHLVSDPEWIHYYFWNTFTRPDERAFLKTYLPGIDAREDFPAAMDLQQRIVERLFALLKRGPAQIDPPPPAADPHGAIEPIADNQARAEEENIRIETNDLSIVPLNEASMAGMCQLARQYHFVLGVVWAPMPPDVLKQRMDRGELPALDKKLKDIFTQNGCQTLPIFDMNAAQTFTNFDIDSLHLRGSGWEQRAASVLAQYLRDLPDRSEPSASATKATSETPAKERASAGL